jgi:signal transduction histidine kinase
MKAAALGGAMGDQGIQAASMSKAAVALANTNRPEEAIALAKKSIVIADSSAQPLNIYQANSSMGTALKFLGNYKEAIAYFEKSLLSLKGSDIYTPDNGELYQELSECYEKTGNYEKALEAHKMSAQISDSVRSRDNIRQATELTMNYEFEKKQQVQQAELKSKDAVARARQLALMVGLGLTFVLAVVSFIGFKNKQKANSLLEQQKQEIESTLTKLKSTQSQLIQSEKMASLGELTAGIAHEIQNPLNFVNNFSELNTELIDELKNELKTGNKEEAISIADDIKENQGKINHHGKRADAIVKGMLHHSRLSTGQKEPININALADEYLRLSYHGLRAKDNSFKVAMKTEFDEGIGKINIVSQDIGRVLLNLFNNAFYSVNEKKKKLGGFYEPVVSVSTKRINGRVEIRVKDNGSGIPQKVLDKIFQPFFTTKPAGQGTGLGLSLSYDIITKEHSGIIKAETKEGEFAEFIIELPVT